MENEKNKYVYGGDKLYFMEDRIPVYGKCPVSIGSDGTAKCYCTGECHKIIGFIKKRDIENNIIRVMNNIDDKC